MFGLNLKRLFCFLLFLAAAIFLGRQYAPPYLARFQFGDAVHGTVKYAASSRKNVKDVRTEILESAKEYGIPIGERDIQITPRGDTYITVVIDYDWPIDLRFHQYQLRFHVSESGEIFAK